MSKYSGEYLNAEICRAIGVNPESVYRVIVDCKVGEVARVITHGFVETDDGKIDRLKRVLRHYEIRPKGRYRMKNPFKRKKPEPEKGQGVDQAAGPSDKGITLGVHMFMIPDNKYVPGMVVRLDDNGTTKLEPPGPQLARLNMKLSISYDPCVRSDRSYWKIEISPEYTYRGQCFGIADVAKLIREVELEFPNNATPWISYVRIADDGRVSWEASYYPEPEEIVKFAEEVQRQVWDILRDYGRTKAIMKAAKKT